MPIRRRILTSRFQLPCLSRDNETIQHRHDLAQSAALSINCSHSGSHHPVIRFYLILRRLFGKTIHYRCYSRLIISQPMKQTKCLLCSGTCSPTLPSGSSRIQTGYPIRTKPVIEKAVPVQSLYTPEPGVIETPDEVVKNFAADFDHWSDRCARRVRVRQWLGRGRSISGTRASADPYILITSTSKTP